MNAVTHLEKVITGEVSAVTHLEKVIAGETSAVTYTEKVITGEATPITHLQKVIAGVESPVTHLEYVWAGGSPTPTEHEYTGAVPYTFRADGSPLISWRISGNTVQFGTPTPDSPVMPQGTGERTGNLFDESIFALVQVTSTAYKYGTSLGVLPQGTYTFSATKSASAQSIYLTARLNGTYSQTTISTVPFTFTADGNSEYIIRTANNTGTTWEAEHYSDIMLNTGSTPLPYQPYGYKLDISSANTTTPVYLGEIESTRQIKKLVLTGQEGWGKDTNLDDLDDYFYTDAINDMLWDVTPISTHFISGRRDVINSVWAGGSESKPRIVLEISKSFTGIISTDNKAVRIDKFKSYLAQQYAAGTPVTVWYVLATPETGIVNEPLMKIGDYADTLSMEQVGVSIPTNNGSTTVDVDTTVKPSEVYIKYKG